jgi:hypothetical protein
MALKPKQKALIEAIIANPSAPHTELAEIVGINRNTITVWKRDAEFAAALDARIKEVWKDSEVIAVDTMRKLAINGDYKASAYILNSLGYAPAQKVEAEVKSANISITIEE